MIWTKFVYVLKWFFEGSLHVCERCGVLTQCFPYGEQTLLHYKSMKERGLMTADTPEITSSWKDKLVCMNCFSIIDDREHAHVLCCERKVD